MSGALALVRASWGTARSYRLGMFVSLATLVLQVVPTYYIGHTLQPFMEPSIRGEGHDFFSFLIVGTVVYLFVAAAVDALPRAVDKGISAGTIEALFATPASVSTLVVGLAGYELLWTGARAVILLAAAAVARAQLVWTTLPALVLVLVLLVGTYFGVGLLASGLVLAFRRAGPLQSGVIVLSALLGGISYPTSMIPAAIRPLSAYVPMTYALRSARRLLVDGAPMQVIGGDVAILTLFAVASLALGSFAFSAGLRYARRTGSLGQY